MKAILFITFLFTSFTSTGQTDFVKIADSVAYYVDKDTTIKPKSITLDTLHTVYGALVKTEATFLAYVNPVTNRLNKIVWNNEGNYYSFVTFYYYNGIVIKGQIKAKYPRTDTNPEFETNSIFYFQNDNVIKEIEFNGSDYRANGLWYLTTINNFVSLAGLKTQ
ncbi:MAG: hypothetical protein ACTHLE_20175 [Agriterribacter sp.]